MTALEIKEKLRQVYLEKKKRGFTDIEDLDKERDELIIQKLQLVAESNIDGNEATHRMINMKKDGSISSDKKEHYELLSLIRKTRVKYFYDNNLVA